jgi:hypothetical protein
VVLAVVTEADIAAAAAVVGALRRAPRPFTCALGGASARGVPRDLGAFLLPEGLDAAVAAVAGILVPGASRAV